MRRYWSDYRGFAVGVLILVSGWAPMSYASDTTTMVMLAAAASGTTASDADVDEPVAVVSFAGEGAATVTRTDVFKRNQWRQVDTDRGPQYLVCPGIFFGEDPETARCRVEAEGFLGSLGHTVKSEPVSVASALNEKYPGQVSLLKLEVGTQNLKAHYQVEPAANYAKNESQSAYPAESTSSPEGGAVKEKGRQSSSDPVIREFETIFHSVFFTLMIVVLLLGFVARCLLGGGIPYLHGVGVLFLAGMPSFFGIVMDYDFDRLYFSLIINLAVVLTIFGAVIMRTTQVFGTPGRIETIVYSSTETVSRPRGGMGTASSRQARPLNELRGQESIRPDLNSEVHQSSATEGERPKGRKIVLD